MFELKTLPLTAFVAFGATVVTAETRIAVLADHYTQDSAERIAQEFAEVFGSLRAGDSFVGLSADGEELWNATLPNEGLYDTHARHRQNALAESWQQAMQYFAVAITDEAHDTQVNFPLVIHDALRYRATGEVHAAFYGDPLWSGSGPYSAFALTGAYPTDAHVAMDRATTPFGRSSDEPLTGMMLHFCEVEGGSYLSGAHEEGVNRTYGLMAQAAGAQLVTFTSDISECSRRFMAGEASNAPVYEPDTAENRFAMVSGDMNIRRATSVAPSNASPELAAAIQSGVVAMVRLTLWDNGGEDGDVVRLAAPGYSREVSLTNAGETFEVPLVHGAMMLTGIHDGGGGITVSVALPDGTHIIDGSMREGEHVALTIPQQ